MIKADTGEIDFAGIFFYAPECYVPGCYAQRCDTQGCDTRGCDTQGCVRKLAALLHAPRAASREDESSLLDWQERIQSIANGLFNHIQSNKFKFVQSKQNKTVIFVH